MTYQEIKSFINTYIVQNGVNAITGSQLNTALNALADYYGFDSVVVTTLPAGSDATVNVQGRTLELGIPKGVDGRDGLDAVNPFKGWFNSLADLKASYTASLGDSAYVKDASPATTWSIYIYDSTASSDNYWADSGLDADTSHAQTFASSEEVNETYIDNTRLVNPADGALPTAFDVLQLKAKLEGVTASETKATNIQDWYPEGKSSGYYKDDSIWNNSGTICSTRINVVGYKSVRFLGYANKATTASYAFVKEDGTFCNGFPKSYKDTSLPDSNSVLREYKEIVPEDAVYLVCVRLSSLINQSNFYCYLQSGERVVDMIPEVDATHLVNPAEGSLSKAEDVMQLKAKLEGVTASETKGSTTLDYNGFIVCKTTSSNTEKTYKYDASVHTFFIPIPQDAKKLRFLGRFVSVDNVLTGYAFINAENQQDIENNIIVSSGGNPKDISAYIVELHPWKNNGTTDNTEINDVTIPNGATYFCAVCGTGHITQSNFYCYIGEGNTVKEEIDKLSSNISSVSDSIHGKAKKYEEINLNEAEKLNECYIDTKGNITASDLQTSYCSYLPIRKGKYLVVAEPISDALQYNTVVAGYNNNIPTIGIQIKGATTGILRGYNATTGSDHIPAPIRMEVYVLEDSYFVFYNNPIGSTVSLYKIESVEENAQYDTYVEEDVYSHFCPTPAYKNTNVQRIKSYLLEEGVNYKVIYRTFKNQSFNSILFKDATGTTIGTSNDANTNSDDNPVEHIMEDVIIPIGTVEIRLQYYVATINASGTADIGMAALMKPLKDDGTMPQNDLVYFVSKVKEKPFPNEPQSTPVQTDIWSAWGVKFPQGHNLKGKPTPLCAYFHGTGGYVTSEVLSYSYPYGTKMHNLLLDNGIAVFDINGKGVSFQADGEYGVERGTRQRHWGCPAAVATAKKAYQVLTERFNCRKGMMVGGCSMGGDIIESYINTYPNDAVACFACAPTNLGALVRTTSFKTNPNSETARAWDSENGDLTNLIGYSKLIYPNIIDENGYVKIWDNMTFTDMYPGINGDPGILDIPQDFVAPWPVETIIWHGTNDTNVNICQSKVWVDAARKAACSMKLRICEGYEHPLMDFFEEIVDFVKSKLLI